MPYNLIPAQNEGQWMEILNNIDCYDTYHLPQYYLIAWKNGEGDPWLFWFREDNYNACVPLLLIENKAKSAYGYPCILNNFNYQTNPKLKDNFQNCFLDFLNKRQIDDLFIRQNPLFRNSWLFNNFGVIEIIGNTVVIDLAQPDEIQLSGLTKGHKYDIRKAIKNGMRVIEGNYFRDIDGFINIYNETMQRNGANEYYYFSRKYFFDLKEKLGNHIRLFFAELNGEITSGALFFFCNRIIQYHLSGTSEKYLDAGGAKCIIDHVRQIGIKEDYQWLHLGGGVGADEENSLFKFKAGFSKIRLPFEIIKWQKIS